MKQPNTFAKRAVNFGSDFGRKLSNNEFVVTVEVHPPRGYKLDNTLKSLELLLDKVDVDAFNTTDIPLAQARLSPIAMSVLLTEKFNKETILHVANRYRNILALQSDLLGAHALGIRNAFVFMGDPPEMGDVPTASSLSDVTSSELIKIVSGMNRGLGLSGNKLDDPTFFTVGCAINLEPDDIESEIESLKRKIDAGADFILSQVTFSENAVEKFANIMGGFPIPLVLGVLPLRSYKHAEFLDNAVPGMNVPNQVLDRLELAGASGSEEGIIITQEILEEGRDLIAGAYVVPAFGRYDDVAKVIGGLSIS
jgi:5,10-methylenetetrahydrofolate reductase